MPPRVLPIGRGIALHTHPEGSPGCKTRRICVIALAIPIVAVDGAGSLYVADTYNHTIRKVVTSTGAVTTLAGMADSIGSADGTGAAARFNGPQGVAVDGAGNLYVADTDNSTIRKIGLANAAVTTIVGVAGQAGVRLGTLPGRLNAPSGVAVSPTGEIFIVGVTENAVLSAY